MSQPIEISIWDIPRVEHKGRLYYIVNSGRIKKGNDYIFTDIDSDDYLDIVEEIQWDKLYIGRVSDIKDIKGLDSLTFLKKLELTNGKIKKVTSLTNLVNLEALDLSNNEIKDIGNLSGLLSLKELYLDNNNIRDLDGKMLPYSLEKLSIKGNPNPNLKNFDGHWRLQS